MKFTPHFDMSQFFRTNRKGIVFNPPQEHIDNMRNLSVNLLEPIRMYIGRPLFITINGGYRPERLNTLIGGSEKSDHMKGMASDLDDAQTSQLKLFKNCCRAIKDLKLSFKQLIYELDSNCVHVSYSAFANRNEILIRNSFKLKNGKTKYVYKSVVLDSAINFNGKWEFLS